MESHTHLTNLSDLQRELWFAATDIEREPFKLRPLMHHLTTEANFDKLVKDKKDHPVNFFSQLEGSYLGFNDFFKKIPDFKKLNPIEKENWIKKATVIAMADLLDEEGNIREDICLLLKKIGYVDINKKDSILKVWLIRSYINDIALKNVPDSEEIKVEVVSKINFITVESEKVSKITEKIEKKTFFYVNSFIDNQVTNYQFEQVSYNLKFTIFTSVETDKYLKEQITDVLLKARQYFRLDKENILQALNSLYAFIRYPYDEKKDEKKYETCLENIKKVENADIRKRLDNIASHVKGNVITLDDLKKQNFENNLDLKDQYKGGFSYSGDNDFRFNENNDLNTKQTAAVHSAEIAFLRSSRLMHQSNLGLSEKEASDLKNEAVPQRTTGIVRQISLLMNDKTDSKRRTISLINAISQDPGQLIYKPFVAVINSEENGILISQIGQYENAYFDPSDDQNYLDCRFESFIINHSDRPIGLFEVNLRAKFKLVEKEEIEIRDGKAIPTKISSYELVYLYSPNPDVHAIYHDKIFTQKEIIERYCTPPLELKAMLHKFKKACETTKYNKQLTDIGRKILAEISKPEYKNNEERKYSALLHALIPLIIEPYSSTDNFYELLHHTSLTGPLRGLFYEFKDAIPSVSYNELSQNLSTKNSLNQTLNILAFHQINLDKKTDNLVTTRNNNAKEIASMSARQRKKAMAYGDAEFQTALMNSNSMVTNEWLKLFKNENTITINYAMRMIKNPSSTSAITAQFPQLENLKLEIQYQRFKTDLNEILLLIYDLEKNESQTKKIKRLQTLAENVFKEGRNLFIIESEENGLKVAIDAYLAQDKFKVSFENIKLQERFQAQSHLANLLLKDHTYSQLHKNKLTEKKVFFETGIHDAIPIAKKFNAKLVKKFENLAKETDVNKKNQLANELNPYFAFGLAYASHEFFDEQGNIKPDVKAVFDSIYEPPKEKLDLFKEFVTQVIFKIDPTSKSEQPFSIKLNNYFKNLTSDSIDQQFIQQQNNVLASILMNKNDIVDTEADPTKKLDPIAEQFALACELFTASNNEVTVIKEGKEETKRIEEIKEKILAQAKKLFAASLSPDEKNKITHALFALSSLINNWQEKNYAKTCAAFLIAETEEFSEEVFNLVEDYKKLASKRLITEKPKNAIDQHYLIAQRIFQQIITESYAHSSFGKLQNLLQHVIRLLADPNDNPTAFYEFLWKNQFDEKLMKLLSRFKDNLPLAQYGKLLQSVERTSPDISVKGKEEKESIVSLTKTIDASFKAIKKAIPATFNRKEHRTAIAYEVANLKPNKVSKALTDSRVEEKLKTSNSTITNLWLYLYHQAEESQHVRLLAAAVINNPFEKFKFLHEELVDMTGESKEIASAFRHLIIECQYQQIRSEYLQILTLSQQLTIYPNNIELIKSFLSLQTQIEDHVLQFLHITNDQNVTFWKNEDFEFKPITTLNDLFPKSYEFPFGNEELFKKQFPNLAKKGVSLNRPVEVHQSLGHKERYQLTQTMTQGMMNYVSPPKPQDQLKHIKQTQLANNKLKADLPKTEITSSNNPICLFTLIQAMDQLFEEDKTGEIKFKKGLMFEQDKKAALKELFLLILGDEKIKDLNKKLAEWFDQNVTEVNKLSIANLNDQLREQVISKEISLPELKTAITDYVYAKEKAALTATIYSKIRSEDFVDQDLAMQGYRAKREIEAIESRPHFDKAQGVRTFRALNNVIKNPTGTGPGGDDKKLPPTEGATTQKKTKTNIEECLDAAQEIGKQPMWHAVAGVTLVVAGVALAALSVGFAIGTGFIGTPLSVGGIAVSAHLIATGAAILSAAAIVSGSYLFFKKKTIRKEVEEVANIAKAEKYNKNEKKTH